MVETHHNIPCIFASLESNIVVTEEVAAEHICISKLHSVPGSWL